MMETLKSSLTTRFAAIAFGKRLSRSRPSDRDYQYVCTKAKHYPWHLSHSVKSKNSKIGQKCVTKCVHKGRQENESIVQI